MARYDNLVESILSQFAFGTHLELDSYKQNWNEKTLGNYFKQFFSSFAKAGLVETW